MAHTHSLIPVSHDNGFPSDHTLLAAALTASLWWIDRRLLLAFAGGTLLVMLGRLGVGVHHTLDVLGAVGIAAVAAVVVRAVPLPATWDRPLLPALRGASGEVARSTARRDPSAVTPRGPRRTGCPARGERYAMGGVVARDRHIHRGR